MALSPKTLVSTVGVVGQKVRQVQCHHRSGGTVVAASEAPEGGPDTGEPEGAWPTVGLTKLVRQEGLAEELNEV